MKKNRWYALSIISLSVFFSLSLWFSASVIADDLRERWALTPLMEGWLSAAVPVGFVAGAFLSAVLGLADRFNTRKLFALSALAGGILNMMILFADSISIGLLLRILTGAALAGVYPPAVKLISLWFPKQRGAAIGILIAALTLGTSLPHALFLFTSGMEAGIVLILSSLLAFTAALLMYGALGEAPVKPNPSVFSIGLLSKVIKNRPVMLANYGYFGHMWELYGMWTWLPAFLAASFAQSAVPDEWSTAAAFTAIGAAGAIGCIAGGLLADRIGRSLLTIAAMGISAACALSIGWTFGSAIWLTVLLAVIWGASVIADSAQFSAAVSDFAEPEYTGTALTFQMCIGFLISVISINLIPVFQMWMGWEWVFAILSIGPVLGMAAMWKVRAYEKNSASSTPVN